MIIQIEKNKYSKHQTALSIAYIYYTIKLHIYFKYDNLHAYINIA